MKAITVYCVQPFWQSGRRLAQGDLRQTDNQDRAWEMARSAARRNAGVILYSVTGNPEYDDWSEPTILARLGEVPV